MSCRVKQHERWEAARPERRVGWQPTRFLTARSEAERAFALAEQLGSVNAAAQELDTTWPSLRKAFTRHGLGMPARNPNAVRQRALAAADSRRADPSAAPPLDPVFVALNQGQLPPARGSPGEQGVRLRRAEEIETLSYRTVVELNAESRLAPQRRVAAIARRPERAQRLVEERAGRAERRQADRASRTHRPHRPHERGMVADARYPQGPAASPGFLPWHLTLAWQRAVTAVLEPLGLTHVQFVLLACAWWMSGQGQVPNQLQLARQAGTDVKMTSQVVRRLEGKGLRSRRLTTASSGPRPPRPPRCCRACSAPGCHATPPPRRSGDLLEGTGADVVNEAEDAVLAQHERAVLDAGDRLADVVLQVGEGLEGEVGAQAGGGLDVGLHLVVGEGEHAAVSVVDEDDLAGAEQVLGDGQGADHVLGDHTAGVADDVGLPLLEPEQSVDVEARVHAGDHGQALARGHRQLALAEGTCELGVVLEQLVGTRHGFSFSLEGPRVDRRGAT